MPQMLDTIGKYNAAFHRVNHIDDKNVVDDQAFSETVNVVNSDHSKVWNSLDVKALSHSTVISQRPLCAL